MKITGANNAKAFQDILVGEMFSDLPGHFYIKTDEAYDIGDNVFDAVCLEDGCHVYFGPTSKVYSVKYTLTVE